jgi:hypothetical protein
VDSGLIGKIDKAKRYAEQRERFLFKKFEVAFRGDNSNHYVIFDDGVFKCDCDFFRTHHRCGHTMALEILLKDMLPEIKEV